MLSNRDGQWLVGLFCLLVVVRAHGALTISISDGQLVDRPVFHISPTPCVSSLDTRGLLDRLDVPVYMDGAAVLERPVGSGESSVSSCVQARSLPGVPGSFFMVLTGFFCVSLIRDRRVWVAAVVGLLWLGQAGFGGLARVHSVLRIGKACEETAGGAAHLFALLGDYCSCADAEDARYVCLLHRAGAIPYGDLLRFLLLPSLQPPGLRGGLSPGTNRGREVHLGLRPGVIAQVRLSCASWPCASGRSRAETPCGQFFKGGSLADVVRVPGSSVWIREWLVFMSPGFILAQLPRGPPFTDLRKR